MTALPSIRRRLLHALVLWALLWCAALALAVWLAVREEVHELMNDSLRSAAAELIGPLLRQVPVPPVEPAAWPGGDAAPRFVWQLVDHGAGARVLRHSAGAPGPALRSAPTPGFVTVPGWHVYGQPLGVPRQMLYVAQSGDERDEALAEVGLGVLLAGLPMGLLGLLWLGLRLRSELMPLRDLSQRLAVHDPLQAGATLGPATREELQPVHQAIDALAARLARRVAQEQAFSGHAAHALRTPLAGIDAQLAVALREAPAALQPRLQRVRDAAGRLQRVVAGLLTLFRRGVEAQPEPLDLAGLAARLPVEGLDLRADGAGVLQADPDLLAAALLNLLDNAQRHQARTVTLSVPVPQTLRVQDDGTGATPERLDRLRQALREGDYAGRTGLGLMLADLVARAHGGRLVLPEGGSGFVVDLVLGPDPAPADLPH